MIEPARGATGGEKGELPEAVFLRARGKKRGGDVETRPRGCNDNGAPGAQKRKGKKHKPSLEKKK